LEAKYSKEKERIKVFKGKEGLNLLAEIISFSSTPDIIVINPKKIAIGNKKRKKVYQVIKKLGELGVKEISSKINGGLIFLTKLYFSRATPSVRSDALGRTKKRLFIISEFSS
jgi:hypothetical protein